MKKLIFSILLLLLMNPPVKAVEEEKVSKNINIYLNELTVEGYEISPQFDKYNNLYTLIIEEAVDELSVIGYTESEDCTIEVTGNTNLTEGENIIEVLLKDNNEENRYQIVVTIESDNTIPIFQENNSNESETISEKELALLIIMCAGIILVSFRLLFIH